MENENRLRILYHAPYQGLLNAYWSIDEGYAHAFQSLGHDCHFLTSRDRLADTLEEFQPHVFITATHFFYRKQLDFDLLQHFRQQGMKVLVKIDFWRSPMKASRINEAKSLERDREAVELIASAQYGDAFFHVLEQGDPRMEGFEEQTGHLYHTIPLAADRRWLNVLPNEQFKSDIAFIGTNLPQKRDVFRHQLLPLGRDFDLRLYGQDWTLADRWRGHAQRAGYYFGIPLLQRLRQPTLSLQEEYSVYASSKISVNLHEDYQRRFGGDCNERTFKIPMAGGFEVVDSVACVKKYFAEDELVVAEDRNDWFDKIRYYMEHADERMRIMAKGQARVLREHTYHHRAQEMLDIYHALENGL